MSKFRAVRMNSLGVDDVAINGTLFRMERLDDKTFWVAMYDGNKRTTFHLFQSGKKIKAKIIENELNCFDDSKDIKVES